MSDVNASLTSKTNGLILNSNTLLLTPSATALTLITSSSPTLSLTIKTFPEITHKSLPSTISHVTLGLVALAGRTSAFNDTAFPLCKVVFDVFATTLETLIPISILTSFDTVSSYLLTTTTLPPFVAVSKIVKIPSFDTLAYSLPLKISYETSYVPSLSAVTSVVNVTVSVGKANVLSAVKLNLTSTFPHETKTNTNNKLHRAEVNNLNTFIFFSFFYFYLYKIKTLVKYVGSSLSPTYASNEIIFPCSLNVNTIFSSNVAYSTPDSITTVISSFETFSGLEIK